MSAGNEPPCSKADAGVHFVTGTAFCQGQQHDLAYTCTALVVHSLETRQGYSPMRGKRM